MEKKKSQKINVIHSKTTIAKWNNHNTINQIKDKLRAMGVKGYSGKNKAELLQMLANPNAFKAAGTPGPVARVKAPPLSHSVMN